MNGSLASVNNGNIEFTDVGAITTIDRQDNCI